MKKIFLLFTIGLLSFYTSDEVISLKGITLKAKHQQSKITTVANIQGIIIPDSLNDGTCYSITFYPSNDGINQNTVEYAQLKKLIDGVERKYGVKLIYKQDPDALSKQTGVYSAIKGTVKFFIDVNYNILLTPEYTIYFSIVDLTLLIKKEQEIQEKENDDF